MAKEKCCRDKCLKDGTHYLSFKVWALGHGKNTTPVSGVLSMSLCENHVHEASSSQDVINDAFWNTIDFALACNGRVQANRDSIEFTVKRGDHRIATATAKAPTHYETSTLH